MNEYILLMSYRGFVLLFLTSFTVHVSGVIWESIFIL